MPTFEYGRGRVELDDKGYLVDFEQWNDRVAEALESALDRGHGQLAVHLLDDDREVAQTLRYSANLHCPDCDIHYRDPLPSSFSFNSPIGACETCRGFGRVIGSSCGFISTTAAKR